MFARMKRHVPHLVGTGLVGALMALSLPGTAHADGPLHITGTVTNQTGGGVQNVSVTATAPGNSTVLFGPSHTAANGSYQLDVDPGTYDIHFVPPAGSGLNPITSNNLVVQTDQVVNVQLTSPSHTMSGTVRDSAGQPVPSLTVRLARIGSSGTVSSTTTDANGHYTVVANAGTYYLSQIIGSAPAPLNFINVEAATANPQYDLTTSDLVQDFVLPTTTLTVTVKDGFGNPVPNAPVAISSHNNATFAVIPGTAANFYNQSSRSGTTNSTGTATLTTFKTTYLVGQICTTVTGNQICNNTQLSVNGPTSLLFQAAPQAPPAPTGLAATTPTQNAPVLSWNAVGVAASYRVYRNGVAVGSTTATSFTDTTVPAAGSYTYTVTAVSQLNVESSASAPFVVVYTTGPVVTNVAVNPNPVTVGHTATLSATATDQLGGIAAGEYFEGADPGEGNGEPMAVAGNTMTATVPGTLSTGQHTFTVRARNSLGHWTRGTLPTVTLTVALPTLNGRVINGANEGIAGVTVDIVDPDDHDTVLATTTANGSGSYAVSVAPGTYDVIFTPPGVVYLPTTKTDIDITVSATLDVVLVLVPTTFSGTLKDDDGDAISGATVSLRNAGGQTFTTTTTGTGSFAVQVNPATYSLTISGTKAAAPLAHVPSSFTLTGGAFDLTDDVHRDLAVNAVTISFTTRSALTSAAVGNVVLGVSTTTATTLYPGSGTYTGSAGYNLTTDGSGLGDLVVLSGTSYSVLGLPPGGSGVVATTFPTVGPVTVDSQRDLDLTADIKHFTGTFADDEGTGIPGATVTLAGPLGTFHTTTNAAGGLDVEAAAGSYTLTVGGSRPSGSTLRIPDSYGFTGGSVDISTADRNQDLTLDAAEVYVTAQSGFGAPLPGVAVQLTGGLGAASLYVGGSFTSTSSTTRTTDSNGVARLLVTKGLAYTTKATPPAGSGYLVTNLAASPPVTADSAAWTIALDRDLKSFSGTVRDRSGVVVAGATVRLDGIEQDQHYQTTTDASGAFTLAVAPNAAYALRVSGGQAGSPTAFLPDNFALTATTSVTGDKVQDITVRAVRLDILARDDRDAPIAGVAIVFASSGSQNGFSASSTNIVRTTGTDGRTEVTMLEGTTYTINATPPTGIGYVNTTFNGTSPIIQDSDTIIEFQNHVPLAPTELDAASPTNASPSLSWDAVADANHYRIFRDGLPIGTSSTTTFVDTVLAVDGTYLYRVSAVSEDDYEGPKSLPAIVVYDTTGPLVGAVTWSTNPVTEGRDTTLTAPVTDPAPSVGDASGVFAGEYFVGSDPGPGYGIPMTLENGQLTATLTASLPVGAHPVGVRARDVAGNWGGVSSSTVTVQSALDFRAIGSGSRSSSGNNSLVSTLTGSADPGDTVVVTVATGTFAGTVGCTDSRGNSYVIAADRNTGNGRLFMCSGVVTTALVPGDTVTATYPGFSGLSVASVNAISGLDNGTVVAASTSSGSNPAVSTGSITPPAAPAVILGAVVNHGTATFTPASGYTIVGQVSAGSGAGRKTITPVYLVAEAVAAHDLTGTLSGSGFWQSAITAYLATE
jgi:hypothetical protein